jgi:hypothetical protein
MKLRVFLFLAEKQHQFVPPFQFLFRNFSRIKLGIAIKLAIGNFFDVV